MPGIADHAFSHVFGSTFLCSAMNSARVSFNIPAMVLSKTLPTAALPEGSLLLNNAWQSSLYDKSVWFIGRCQTTTDRLLKKETTKKVSRRHLQAIQLNIRRNPRVPLPVHHASFCATGVSVSLNAFRKDVYSIGLHSGLTWHRCRKWGGSNGPWNTTTELMISGDQSVGLRNRVIASPVMIVGFSLRPTLVNAPEDVVWKVISFGQMHQFNDYCGYKWQNIMGNSVTADLSISLACIMHILRTAFKASISRFWPANTLRYISGFVDDEAEDFVSTLWTVIPNLKGQAALPNPYLRFILSMSSCT